MNTILNLCGGRPRRLISLLCASASLGWAAPEPDDHDDHDDHDHAAASEHDDELHLDPRDAADLGIEVAVAGPGIVRTELRLPGEVSVNENTLAHVGPRFAGVVTRIRQRLGAVVTAGDLLAELETNDTLRPFALHAPIAGTVVASHMTPGESLDAGHSAYVIADTSTVWVNLRVYQRDLPRVQVGQPVRLSAGRDYPDLVGTIDYVGPIVDETTRTGLARVEVGNPDGLLRPGLFVIGQVTLAQPTRPVVVPLSAVQTVAGKTVIYVETPDGDGFAAQAVELGLTDAVAVEIRQGLTAGQRYVAVGGFFLKADAEKARFGHGHNH